MANSITTRRTLALARLAQPIPPTQAPGFRLYERRWRDASFFVVERRRGKAWMYGSIGLAAALWAFIYFFLSPR